MVKNCFIVLNHENEFTIDTFQFERENAALFEEMSSVSQEVG